MLRGSGAAESQLSFVSPSLLVSTLKIILICRPMRRSMRVRVKTHHPCNLLRSLLSHELLFPAAEFPCPARKHKLDSPDMLSAASVSDSFREQSNTLTCCHLCVFCCCPDVCLCVSPMSTCTLVFTAMSV
ncbi:hypothetical protein ILYODFUR_011535 [Ilyodon furcidens]|uniref:Uncharacterized protein n=1 Tax=Ilyodon furcidens TaxID=33524 RepID=A0ABV0V321_9TELE